MDILGYQEYGTNKQSMYKHWLVGLEALWHLGGRLVPGELVEARRPQSAQLELLLQPAP